MVDYTPTKKELAETAKATNELRYRGDKGDETTIEQGLLQELQERKERNVGYLNLAFGKDEGGKAMEWVPAEDKSGNTVYIPKVEAGQPGSSREELEQRAAALNAQKGVDAEKGIAVTELSDGTLSLATSDRRIGKAVGELEAGIQALRNAVNNPAPSKENTNPETTLVRGKPDRSGGYGR